MMASHRRTVAGNSGTARCKRTDRVWDFLVAPTRKPAAETGRVERGGCVAASNVPAAVRSADGGRTLGHRPCRPSRGQSYPHPYPSLPHTRTRTHTRALSLSVFRCLSLALCLPRSLSFSLAFTFSYLRRPQPIKQRSSRDPPSPPSPRTGCCVACFRPT